MTYGEWIESLQILAKSTEKGLDEKYPIQAEHDEIYCTSDEVSPEGRARLEALGWREEKDCGWSHFT